VAICRRWQSNKGMMKVECAERYFNSSILNAVGENEITANAV